MRPDPLCVPSLAAVMLCALPATSAQEVVVRAWGTADGLPHPRVNAIRRDREGHVWFATFEGAGRFDGRRCVSFGAAEGLSNPLVWSIAEAPDGTIWLGTHGGGLARRAPGERAFRVDARGPANPAQRVYEIVFDPRGAAWIVTDQGLFAAPLQHGAQLEFAPVAGFEAPWFGRHVRDARGDPTFVGADEVCRFESIQAAPARWPLPPEARGEVRAACARAAGGLWVARLRSLWIVEVGARAGERAQVRQIELGLDPGASLYDVAEDDSGRAWVATSAGLVRIDSQGVRRLSVEHGLPDRWVRALTPEPGGGLWIGTHQAGAAFLPAARDERYSQRSGLGDGHAAGITVLPAGGALATMEVSGVFEIDATGVRLVPGSDRPPFDRIQHSLVRDAQGEWWIGVEAGLFRAAGERGPDLARAELQGAKQGLASLASRVLGLDPHGEPVVATTDGRIFAREPASGRFRDLGLALPQGPARSIAWAKDGSAWVEDGRRLWRAHGGALEPVEWPEAQRGPLEPRALLVDAHGRLWVGTRFQGLFVVHDPQAERPRLEGCAVHGGHRGEAVFALAEDQDGDVVAGTSRGVRRIALDRAACDLVLGPEAAPRGWVLGIAVGPDGDVWAAGPEGVTRLRGGPRRAPPPPPRTRFTRCAVAGGELELPPAGSAELPAIEVLERQSGLEFEFVAVDPSRGHRLLYQSRLEPQEADWSRPAGDGVLRYAGLAAGRYRLAVRALDPASALPGEPACASITVLPPAWRRPETVAAAALALLAAGWAVHRARLRRAQALERVRSQIAADLHDDIGAGLARIAITSELARRGAHEERGLALREVATAARELRSSMSDLVWALDARHGTLLDLVGRLRRCAVELVEESGAALDVRAPAAELLASVPVAPDRKRHLYLICKEALANSARHARARSVEVLLALDEHTLRLEVRDDGLGFEPARVAAGNGLANLRRRARELGAELVVESAPSRGTRVVLTAPATRAEREAARRNAHGLGGGTP
ncbi:MAG: hypothetical protein JNK02_05895 [Planctomycetes bacterium]|nr:hypothetical protein [Planctomycetota bacterium]